MCPPHLYLRLGGKKRHRSLWRESVEGRWVAFGANFVNVPSREDAINSAKRRSEEICRLISVGVDWDRKGMARSIRLAATLNARGLRTQLDIVGCRPPAIGSPLASFEAMLPDWVTVHGFIDKRTEHGEATLSKL